MSISSDLRKAAMGPTPAYPSCADSWIGGNAYWFVRRMSHVYGALLCGMTDNERRMYLLFLANAAEDEGK